MIAELRELANDLLGQTDDDADMGRTNNTIVVNERPHFETWEDVVRWARAKIVESAKYNGDGEDGRAAWYEKQPSDWRPDFTRVPITPLPKGRVPTVEPMAMAEASGATGTGGQRTGGTPPSPLDRPIATWSQGDVRIVINSPAYLRSQHPRHREAQRMSASGSKRSSARVPPRSTPPGVACVTGRGEGRSG